MMKTKMRLSRSYSNLDPFLKSIWHEYIRVRKDWKHYEALLNVTEKPKPRYKYDIESQRYRPISHITRWNEINELYTKSRYRLLELALYLYNFDYIAPDFNEKDLYKF